MFLFLLFCLSISNLRICHCNIDKRVLSDEELLAEDNGDENIMVAQDESLNSESEPIKGEKDDQSESADISSNVERVMNHEDDEEKQQLNDKDGESDGFEKYEGVFGGYGDDTRSKRVKRVEE